MTSGSERRFSKRFQNSSVLVALLLLMVLVVPIQVRAAVEVGGGFSPNIVDGYSIIINAVQPDGKIHISGEFTEVDGVPRNGFARLNNDGSLDPHFDPNVNDRFRVNAVQPDSKILISGSFTEIDGMPRGKHYILTFPTYKSNDAIFGVEIEEHTTVVDKKHCDRSEYK